MSDKKKPEGKEEKPKKPSLIKTGAKFAGKHPIGVAAGAAAAVFGSGLFGAIAIGTAANKAYKNRDKLGEIAKDPGKVKGMIDEGAKKVKDAFDDAVDRAKDGFDEGSQASKAKAEQPEAETTEETPKAEKPARKPRRRSGPSND